MVVGGCFNFSFGGSKGLMSDGSVGVKQILKDLRDRSFKQTGFAVDQIGKAVFINGGVDLLDDGSFNEVAGLENDDVVYVFLPGCRDLRCC
jgi:hypothetical protein